MQTSFVFEGLALGWSVAWPPGPINAEIMRRALARGFFAGFVVGLGAVSGDAFWAVTTALGAGLLLAGAAVRMALGVISTALLFALAGIFLKGALAGLRASRPAPPLPGRFDSPRAGYGMGLVMALTSPWNLAFWLAVMARPQLAGRALGAVLMVAASVVAGALAWCVIFCGAVTVLRLRAATALWDIVAKGATGVLLLAFALAGVWRLAGI